MADNGFKINKSVNFNPQTGTPANPVDGDFFYDAVAQSFVYYHNGSWANFDSVGVVSSVLWLTSAQFTPAIVRNSVVKVTGAGALSHLAGISASFSAKRITIYNAGAYTIVVEPEDANEPTVNNRIQTPTGGSMNLVAGEIAVFTYDVVANRWLLVSISSQAGAQIIATTANPGLVTLHQASLLPLDGVVLSDGDLNTANGVVGLDANRAATIAAPLSAVTALTVTANGSANAVTLNGPLNMQTNTSIIKLYGGGTVGGINSGGYGTSFITCTDAGGTGEGRLWSDVQVEHLTHFSVTESIAGGTLYLTARETSSRIWDPVNGAPIDIGPSAEWRFATDGTLSKNGTVAQIKNVANPTLAQDVATKIFVEDTYHQNYIINGRFDFWQRLPNTGSFTFTHSGGIERNYVADRWYFYSTGSGTVGDIFRITGADSAAGANYSLRCQRPNGDNKTTTRGIVQEIDRRWVELMRGRSFTVGLRIRVGANFSGGAGGLTIYFKVDNGGSENENSATGYTGSITQAFSQPAPSLGGSFVDYYLNIPTLPTNITTAALQIVHTPSGTAGANDWFEISLCRLVDGTGHQPPFSFSCGDYENEFRKCQEYFEKSWEFDVALPPTVPVVEGSHAAIASNAFAGTYLWCPGPRFRAMKRSGLVSAPTITLYDFLNASGMVNVQGLDGLAGTVMQPSLDGFHVRIGVASGAAGDYVNYHWVANAEI